MTIIIQKLLAMLLLATGIGLAAQTLLSSVSPEPAEGALLICGFVSGLFIAWQRLNNERFIP
jgi:hypothetical protein